MFNLKSRNILPFTALTAILIGLPTSQFFGQTMAAVAGSNSEEFFLVESKENFSQINFSQISFSQITVASAVKSDRELAALEQLAYEQVNQYRASLDLAPLQFNAQISEQARIHSQNMANETVEFSHDGFENRVEALKGAIDYRGAAENVAYNLGYADPVSKAVEGWIKSPGHHQNMTGNYNLTGIGVAKNQEGEYYFTQIFILEK